jgi:uncharacterized protein (TIGR02246 family)
MSIATNLSTRMSATLVAALFTGVTALPGPVAAATAPAERGRDRVTGCERKFDEAVRTYVRTTYDRDAEGFNALLHQDVTAVLPGGYTLIGREEVAAFIDGFFARTDWTQTLDVRHTAVDGCDTALVLFDSVYTDGDGAVPLAIIITWTYHRGQWQVLVDQNTVVATVARSSSAG